MSIQAILTGDCFVATIGLERYVARINVCIIRSSYLKLTLTLPVYEYLEK